MSSLSPSQSPVSWLFGPSGESTSLYFDHIMCYAPFASHFIKVQLGENEQWEEASVVKITSGVLRSCLWGCVSWGGMGGVVCGEDTVAWQLFWICSVISTLWPFFKIQVQCIWWVRKIKYSWQSCVSHNFEGNSPSEVPVLQVMFSISRTLGSMYAVA